LRACGGGSSRESVWERIGALAEVLEEVIERGSAFSLVSRSLSMWWERSFERYGAEENHPPSTTMSVPVMYDDSSLARKSAV
jgi:hypothetical protein